ncbi:hypothetical protein BDR07DRAFT_1439473 [Suillus spraguei]|nr:hypothetical protein BDR07DRAFT_1439473 [Suillus spraguei]
MSHIFTRNLTFQSNDLSKETTIMLTFDADMKGLYEDFFPVCKFGRTGQYRTHATYTNQLAFSKPQVAGGNIIDAETSVKINVSEKTFLTEANNVYHFSSPQSGTPGVLQAVNNTGATQDMAVGFMNPGDLTPKPALYFCDVGDGSHVTARFTPVLRAYIMSDYEETALIRDAVASHAIWSQDLTRLPESTTWTLKRDAATGRYTLD